MWGVVANVASDRILRTGAKVRLDCVNGDAECPRVWGLNKSGRMVHKFTHFKRLRNFRTAWIPEQVKDSIVWKFPTKEEAQTLADTLAARWTGVRFFNRDGSQMLQDGVSVNEAFARRVTSAKLSDT